MDETLDRREFLGATAAVSTLSTAGVAPKAAASPVRHFFLVENGTPNAEGFHVSMISCNQATRHLAALATIRKRTNYLQELTYPSTDRWKTPYVKRAIEHLMASPDMMAHTVRVDRFTNWHQRSPDDRRGLYFSIYHQLFATAAIAGKTPRAAVHLLARSTDNRDHLLAADLRDHLGPRTTVTLGAHAYKEMAAVAAVIFGTIKADIDMKGADTGASKVKLAIRDILRGAAKVSVLDLAQLALSGKFAVATMHL